MREESEREDRILFNVVVDAYNEEERAMGWYYYLADEMQFPFAATCTQVRATSPLRVGQIVQVLGMADPDDCIAEMMVNIAYGDALLAVPLMQLQCVPANDGERNMQAVEDWRYWVASGYQF